MHHTLTSFCMTGSDSDPTPVVNFSSSVWIALASATFAIALAQGRDFCCARVHCCRNCSKDGLSFLSNCDATIFFWFAAFSASLRAWSSCFLRCWNASDVSSPADDAAGASPMRGRFASMSPDVALNRCVIICPSVPLEVAEKRRTL